MSTSEDQTAPKRDARHEALAVFLGRWRAEGLSYGSAEQREDDPKQGAVPWLSTHTGRWHTGEFFLVQEEQATTGGHPFDTLAVMGVDARTGRHFARAFENHGFYRHYDVTVEGRLWTLTGESERARIELSPGGETQTITWQWRPRGPQGPWLPLCDRVARRQD